MSPAIGPGGYPEGYTDPPWDGTLAGYRDVVVPARVNALKVTFDTILASLGHPEMHFEFATDGGRRAVSDDPIGDALRADADAARAEIREAGISCPSCGVNLGDLYGRGHRYEGASMGVPAGVLNLSGTFRCAEGAPVDAASLDWESVKAAAEIGFLDHFWQAESEYFDKHVIGTSGGNFTGILGMLP